MEYTQNREFPLRAIYCVDVAGVAISVGAIIGVLIALIIVAVIGCRRYVQLSSPLSILILVVHSVL